MEEKSKSNKRYLRKNIFQKYEENPFVEKAIEVVKANSSHRKQYMNGNKGVQQIVLSDSGEIVGQTMFAKIVEVDEDRFAKLYLNELGLLWEMNKASLRVFSFILSSLTPNNDQFYLSNRKALEYTGYKSQSQLNTGISKLLELGIIAKALDEHMYFVNPMFVFNGSRITFAKTYVKKTKTNTLDNPNQLSLLDEIKSNEDSFNNETFSS